jgi:Transposase IS66 family
MRSLRRKAAAKARQGEYRRRSAAASGNRGATGEGAYHRISVSERSLWRLWSGYARTLAEEIAGQFGPQLTALIAYWTVVCRLPRRLVEAMLADVLGIDISLGSTQKAWEEVSHAVEQPVRQLQEQLPREAVLNVDETGWRTNGDKRWIWALVANGFAFYVVASTRGAEVLVSLLGAVFRGILCSDRWVVYLTYHSGRMQLCWAHLKRTSWGSPIMRAVPRRGSSAGMPWPL